MKQGETKRKQPKDKHTKASWKKRDEGRKLKQEHYHLSSDEMAAFKLLSMGGIAAGDQ